MKNKNSVLIILVTLFGFNILAWLAVFDLSRHKFLEVTFFDVGQGDAAFIETSQNHQILIDGGPDSIILEKLGKEMPFYDRTIDLVILTHPEADHMAGLLEVLKRYKVENILWTGIVRNTASYKEWINLVAEEKANVFIANSGQCVRTVFTHLCVLYPFESLEGQEFKDSNNSSIVSRLIYGQTSFLFTGDIYQSIEGLLLSPTKQQLSAEVLKVAHHGSKTSSSEDFLKAVLPQIAVISLSENNSYGHPHPEVLERLEKYDIDILRTDLQGDIKIISDGENYEVSHF